MAQPVQHASSARHSGPFTAEDRAAMPEDGRRVELVDGHLVVSPSPGRAHDDLQLQLFRQLDSACPDDITLYSVPYDVRLPDGSELVPDITVARTADPPSPAVAPAPLSDTSVQTYAPAVSTARTLR